MNQELQTAIARLQANYWEAYHKHPYDSLTDYIAEVADPIIADSRLVAQAYVDLHAAVHKFLFSKGHDLCHDNRRELAAMAGIDIGQEVFPDLPPEEEFEQRCASYRKDIYAAK